MRFPISSGIPPVSPDLTFAASRGPPGRLADEAIHKHIDRMEPFLLFVITNVHIDVHDSKRHYEMKNT
jgi:hypothetical protein